MTLNTKIGGFMVFLTISGCDTSLNIIHQVAPHHTLCIHIHGTK